MNNLSYDLLINTFREHGISQDDYMKSEELYALMSELNGGEFDKDIYDQLWDECRLNSIGEAKASDFCHLILKAEKILSDNEREAIMSIIDLQSKLAVEGHVMNLAFSQKVQARQLESKMVDAKENKLGFQTDLELLRKPFQSLLGKGLIDGSNQFGGNEGLFGEIHPDILSLNKKTRMTILFYLLLTLSALEIPIIFYLPHFPNVNTILSKLLLFLFVGTIFLFQHINKRIIRFLLVLDVGSILLDITWLIFVMGSLWSIPSVANYPQFIGGYLKFCICLFFPIVIGKAVMAAGLFIAMSQSESTVYHANCFGRVLTIGSSYTQTNPLIELFPNQGG